MYACGVRRQEVGENQGKGSTSLRDVPAGCDVLVYLVLGGPAHAPAAAYVVGYGAVWLSVRPASKPHSSVFSTTLIEGADPRPDPFSVRPFDRLLHSMLPASTILACSIGRSEPKNSVSTRGNLRIENQATGSEDTRCLPSPHSTCDGVRTRPDPSLYPCRHGPRSRLPPAGCAVDRIRAKSIDAARRVEARPSTPVQPQRCIRTWSHPHHEHP